MCLKSYFKAFNLIVLSYLRNLTKICVCHKYLTSRKKSTSVWCTLPRNFYVLYEFQYLIQTNFFLAAPSVWSFFSPHSSSGFIASISPSSNGWPPLYWTQKSPQNVVLALHSIHCSFMPVLGVGQSTRLLTSFRPTVKHTILVTARPNSHISVLGCSLSPEICKGF